MTGRRGRRGGSRRGRGVTRRQLHNTVFGHSIRTNFDPPNFVDKPWNSVTVELGFAGDKKVTPVDIVPVALKQIGLDDLPLDKTTIEFRFLKCRVWGLSVSRPVRCSFFGISATSNAGPQAYGVMTDWGAPNRLPHVGWQWPVSVQQTTWVSTSKDLVFSVDVGTTGTDADIPWLAYLDILWRSSKYSPISERIRYQMSCTPAPRTETTSSGSSLSASFQNLNV